MAQEPHQVIWSLSTGIVLSRCLHVAAEIGVADALDDTPVSTLDLAARCGANADALRRVLELLAVHGVFERHGDAYAHTDSSRLLRSDQPGSMRAFARMMGLPVVTASFAHLDHSVRTGQPGINLVAANGLWAHLQDHPDDAAVFGEAMTGKAHADIAAVLATYDFSPFANIADVGGGRGHLLRAVLDTTPTAKGILFDLPNVIDTLAIPRERLTVQAGDFFSDPLPTADAYVLMEVLHDWGDEEAAAILAAVRRAAHEGSTVLIVEPILDPERADPRVRTADVIMLAVTGGRERTPAELDALLSAAGFRLNRVIDTPSPMRIVEATT